MKLVSTVLTHQSADKLARVKSMSSPHNLCIRLDTDKEEECLLCMGDRLLGEKSVHEYMTVPQIPQESIGQSPSNAQSLSLSKGLVIPMSHDENVHHVDSHNPYRVPPPASKAKPSLTTEKLYDPVDPLHFPGTKSPLARAAGYMASDTCLACEVPNRYMVHCHKFYPELLSQVDVSCEVLGESDLLQETVSNVSEYMLHEANIPSDSGYHSAHQTVLVHLDMSSCSTDTGSVNKVPCPFQKGNEYALVYLPGKTDEILSSVLFEDTGHSDVKLPGQVLPLIATLRVSRENTANAAGMSASFGQSETFIEPKHPISCNSIVHPIEEKVLPSPIEFPAQSMTASHPIGLMKIWRTMFVEHQHMSNMHQPMTMPLPPLMSL